MEAGSLLPYCQASRKLPLMARIVNKLAVDWRKPAAERRAGPGFEKAARGPLCAGWGEIISRSTLPGDYWDAGSYADGSPV